MRNFIFLFLVLVSGCTSVGTRTSPYLAIEPPEPSVSLFSSDSAILSDAEIQRILTTKIEVPENVRIALLYLEHKSLPNHPGRWYHWRNEPEQKLMLVEGAFQRLLQSPRVYDVSYLPTFILPTEKSIGLVREAAARYQADWVLVFRTETKSQGKQNFFHAEEGRASCVAECALLDVRTGIIPFTSRASCQLTIEEEKGDWDLEETVARAERKAVEAAMSENVDNLVAFMGQMAGTQSQNHNQGK